MGMTRIGLLTSRFVKYGTSTFKGAMAMHLMKGAILAFGPMA